MRKRTKRIFAQFKLTSLLKPYPLVRPEYGPGLRNLAVATAAELRVLRRRSGQAQDPVPLLRVGHVARTVNCLVAAVGGKVGMKEEEISP